MQPARSCLLNWLVTCDNALGRHPGRGELLRTVVQRPVLGRESGCPQVFNPNSAFIALAAAYVALNDRFCVGLLDGGRDSSFVIALPRTSLSPNPQTQKSLPILGLDIYTEG